MKSVGVSQWERQNYYVYGLVEPKTGENFFGEISHLDTECFPAFLNCFSQNYPQDLDIIQLDNGSFHPNDKLIVPENIILLFQPVYCPELNPIERLWEYSKSFLSWELFSDLSDLKAQVNKILKSLTKEIVTSVTGWKYILDALSVVQI